MQLSHKHEPDSDEKYRSLFNSMDQGFCIVEILENAEGRAVDYRFLEVNPAFQRHTGLVNAVGKTILELAPGHDAHWFEIYGKIARTGAPVRFVQHASTMGGRWFDVYAFRLGDPANKHVAILFTDITQRKSYEDELARSNRSKDEFLAMLAHELRNPLAPLANSLTILKRPGIDVTTVASLHDLMARQVEHLTRLVDDLLDVSRLTAGKVTLRKEQIELRTVVMRAIEMCKPFIEQRRQILSVAISPIGVMLEADPVRLAQVIGNLLNNSAKYSPEGSRIRVEAGPSDGVAVVRVIDSGIGIAPNILSRIFDLFVQGDNDLARSAGGLGIGLALVKLLVEMHGGTVQAQSGGNEKGSTFEVRLPISTASSSQVRPVKKATCPQKRRVAVVDDNQDSRETMALMLRLDGHEVETAATGPDAIKLVHRFHPQVALVDLGLPGCDGYEVARTLRREFSPASLCLVATTGYSQDEDKFHTKEVGFNCHLVKPVAQEAIEKILAESPSDNSTQR